MTYFNPGYFVCTYFPLYFQTVLKTVIPVEEPGSHGIPGVLGIRRVARPAAIPTYCSAISTGSSTATAAIISRIILAATSAGTSTASCTMLADASAVRRHNAQAISAALHHFYA
jgi:hypothetical protein